MARNGMDEEQLQQGARRSRASRSDAYRARVKAEIEKAQLVEPGDPRSASTSRREEIERYYDAHRTTTRTRAA